MAKNKKSKPTYDLDILGHFLVPKPELLSESEKKALLKKFNINEDGLPKIKDSDPVSKKLDAKVGDVVKFEREDPTGKYVYYRAVV